MAIDSSAGSGRNMDAYYKNLLLSQHIYPIMVYSNASSFSNAPNWITDKILFDMPYATHPIDLCSPAYCSLLPEQHIVHEQWMHKFAKHVQFLKSMYTIPVIWLLDMVLPIIEKPMGEHIVQVFHGELFQIGPLPYIRDNHIRSLRSYGRLLLSGKIVRDELVTFGQLDPNDPRMRRTGRVLDDTLYTGELDKKKILKQYRLDPRKKTLLYAPTWESLKIWPIGQANEDEMHLYNYCKFLSDHNLNGIIRPHHICILQYGVKPKILRVLRHFRNVYFDDSSISSYWGPNKSLIAADYMITDISSISTEFFSLGKPVVYLYPDQTQGLWGERFPTVSDVRKFSYVATSFEELFHIIHSLVKSNESDTMLTKRRKNAAYVLDYRDGSAGKRFLYEMDDYALEIKRKHKTAVRQIKDTIRRFVYPHTTSIRYFSAQLLHRP